MAETEWTLERICAALGNNPEINKQIFSEINNKATEATIKAVFAKWRERAEETLEAVGRARAEIASDTPPKGGIEYTIDDLKARAARLRAAAA